MPRHKCQHLREQARRAPPSKPSVNRTPRVKYSRQIAPWNACAQNIDDSAEHDAIVLRRTPSQRPPARFGPRPVNFFSPSHNGSGSSHRWTGFMRALRSVRCARSSSDFEDTSYSNAGSPNSATRRCVAASFTASATCNAASPSSSPRSTPTRHRSYGSRALHAFWRKSPALASDSRASNRAAQSRNAAPSAPEPRRLLASALMGT